MATVDWGLLYILALIYRLDMSFFLSLGLALIYLRKTPLIFLCADSERRAYPAFSPCFLQRRSMPASFTPIALHRLVGIDGSSIISLSSADLSYRWMRTFSTSLPSSVVVEMDLLLYWFKLP